MRNSAALMRELLGGRSPASRSFSDHPRQPLLEETSGDVISLLESASPRGIYLTREQAKQVLRLLESQDDPFMSRESIISTDDLENLGIDYSEERQIGIVDDQEDPILGSKVGSGRPTEDRSKLNVQVSLVAPNATPHSNSPIPDEVLVAMSVVSGTSFEEVPQTPEKPSQPSRPAQPRPNSPVSSSLQGIEAGLEPMEAEDEPQPGPTRPVHRPSQPRKPHQEGLSESISSTFSAIKAARGRNKNGINSRKTVKKPADGTAPSPYMAKLSRLG